jgi:hypothetical protein
MSTQMPSQPMVSEQRVSPWASGLTVFAAALMVVTGIWQIFAGIAALIRDEVYVATPQYIYSFDLTGWGWVHLILGILVVATGFGVIQGQTWARMVGILLVSLSLIANFLFIPYYPLWSLTIIALDVAVIWALATYRREVV